jgi:hypothetical protein
MQAARGFHLHPDHDAVPLPEQTASPLDSGLTVACAVAPWTMRRACALPPEPEQHAVPSLEESGIAAGLRLTAAYAVASRTNEASPWSSTRAPARRSASSWGGKRRRTGAHATILRRWRRACGRPLPARARRTAHSRRPSGRREVEPGRGNRCRSLIAAGTRGLSGELPAENGDSTPVMTSPSDSDTSLTTITSRSEAAVRFEIRGAAGTAGGRASPRSNGCQSPWTHRTGRRPSRRHARRRGTAGAKGRGGLGPAKSSHASAHRVRGPRDNGRVALGPDKAGVSR